jgi:membrane associated rhomboid family serine protease
MPRYPHARTTSYSFGPGPLSPAIRALIIANVAMFVVRVFFRGITNYLGLIPADLVEHFFVWQPFTYMFLHGSFFHILFNMLALWMFGTELEWMWGTRYFLWYYFVTGLAAAATTVAVSLLPFPFADGIYYAATIGASGAIYGLLLAYGLYFPNRPIYLYLIFPIPAKYFVMLMGAVAFLSSASGAGGGIAHTAHLGGLVAGYLVLARGRTGGIRLSPWAEVKYRYLKWKLDRAKRRFGVHSGGRRDDWDRRIH